MRPRPNIALRQAQPIRRRYNRGMSLARRHRSLAALCAAFALAYAQLLFSGYSCAMLGFGDEMGSPTMCQLHCDYEEHAVDIAKPVPPPMLAMPNAFRVAVVDPAPLSARQVRSQRAAPGPAPPLIGFTVLRI